MKKRLTLLAAAIALTGCANTEEKKSPFYFDRILKSDEPYQAPDAPNVEVKDDQLKDAEATIYPGDDRLYKAPKARKALRIDGDAVQMNFEEAPLGDVVHAILGDTLKLDYVIEHPIKGKITLRTRSPIPRDQLLEVLESLLQANGVLMVRDPNDRFFVSPSKSLLAMVPQFESMNSTGMGFSNTIVPLQYIGATEMADILKPVATDGSFVRIDTARNMLILAGTRVQMRGWLEIIESFDIDALKGMSVGVFPLEHAEVDEIQEAVGQVIASTGEFGKGQASQLVKIIPLERLGAIMVVSPRKALLERVRTWIDRLDKLPDSGAERQLFVYPVQNGTAEQLSGLLGQLFGSGGSRRTGTSGVSPGLNKESVSADGKKSSNKRNSAKPNSGGSSSVFLEGDVKVVADEDNNALLIYSTSAEYRKIEKALKKLDIAPTQIMVEASIIEVTLNDSLAYGLEWAFSGKVDSTYSGAGIQTGGKGTKDENGFPNLVASLPGFSYSLTSSTHGVRAVLNTLAKDSLLNVISSPSIMVLDNHTATIKVGTQVPVETGSDVTSTGVVSNRVEYTDTGVDLEVTPSVNAGGMVTMDVAQSVKDAGLVDEVSGQRSFQSREINTRIAIRSGESVVLGGLITENKTEGSSGLPWLHSLPVVGALFGSKSQSKIKTELLVILTPRVLFNEQDMRDVSREMRNRISNFTLFDE
ncbi:MAG: type II secretion system secretin GspD [Cellvibrionaceae bacterium]|nr:type II secretion system secretin GspD [Cellvibrionaceae bacterium]